MKWPKFMNKKTDEKVEAILKETSETTKDTAKVAKELRDLLKKNGVTLQIFIATGGEHRK